MTAVVTVVLVVVAEVTVLLVVVMKVDLTVVLLVAVAVEVTVAVVVTISVDVAVPVGVATWSTDSAEEMSRAETTPKKTRSKQRANNVLLAKLRPPACCPVLFRAFYASSRTIKDEPNGVPVSLYAAWPAASFV
jgi:hypothetical protein